MEVLELKRLINTIKKINEKSLNFFNEIFPQFSHQMGKLLYDGMRNIDRLSSFYDEKNFIALFAYSSTDSDEVYRKISDTLLKTTIPKLVEMITICKERINDQIDKVLMKDNLTMNGKCEK